LGTDARKSNMKKRKKMGDIGRLFLTKSRKELSSDSPARIGTAVTSAMNAVGQDSASSHFGT
jgi:hypothetical protein